MSAFFDPDSLNDFDSAVVDVFYPGNANPAYPVTTSQVVPFEMHLFNPCNEDIIYLSGELRQVVSSMFSRNRFRDERVHELQRPHGRQPDRIARRTRNGGAMQNRHLDRRRLLALGAVSD